MRGQSTKLFWALFGVVLSFASSTSVHAASDNNCSKTLSSLFSGKTASNSKALNLDEEKIFNPDILVQPTGLNVVLEAKLTPPKANLLKSLVDDKGNPTDKKLYYVISPDDQVFFSSDPVKFNSDETLFGKIASAKSDAGQIVFPVKEGGEVLYDSTTKKRKNSFELRKQYGVELSQEEVDSARDSLAKHLSSNQQYVTATQPSFKHNFSRARVMKCQKILAEGRNAKKFIVTKLGTDLSLLTAGIAITAPGRFDSVLTQVGLQEEDPDRDYDGDLLAADYTTTSLNTVFRAGVGYVAATEGVAFLQRRFGPTASSLMMRSSSTALSVGLQTLIYSTMTDNDAGGIGAYNLGYSVFSMVKSHYVDKFILSKLPDFAYNSCLKNPALRFIVGQKSFRLVEGMASTVLYLGGRSILVGEGGNEPQNNEEDSKEAP